MKKEMVLNFLNLIGYKVADEKYLLRKNAEDDNDEVEDFVEEEEEEEDAVQNAVPPQFQKKNPAQATPDQSGQQGDQNNAPDNIAQLNQLITDIGGMETFKAVLLAAVEYGKMAQGQGNNMMGQQKPAQNAEQRKRSALITKIVTNVAEVTEDDLENLPTPALVAMAKPFSKKVDYSALGALDPEPKQNKSIPRPHFLIPAPASEGK